MNMNIITFQEYLTGIKNYLTAFQKYLTGVEKYLTAFQKYLTGVEKYLTTFQKYLTGVEKYLTTFQKYLTRIENDPKITELHYRDLTDKEQYALKLDDYEAALQFTPKWVSINEAIVQNNKIINEVEQNSWVKRENYVLNELKKSLK
ncbi:hypothetical protein [Sutcliffiella cohnii]|uniref:hypothetical protein n=1 Tax=Sutcliffiella cohnii TaxID=33932 RepID=UPI002E1D2445|nr:hypothetical protein [Sutcliffiella cohnii]